MEKHIYSLGRWFKIQAGTPIYLVLLPPIPVSSFVLTTVTESQRQEREVIPRGRTELRGRTFKTHLESLSSRTFQILCPVWEQ